MGNVMVRALAIAFGLFYCAVGVAFVTSPASSVTIFGVDASHMADVSLASALGVRQLALGVIIVWLALAQPKAGGMVLLIASAIPLRDASLANKAFGFSVAARHLVVVAASLLLGLLLIRK